jgi:hypothetical protein
MNKKSASKFQQAYKLLETFSKILSLKRGKNSRDLKKKRKL